MQLVIPDDILSTTQLSAADIKREIALFFLHNYPISLTQAADLAEMSEQEIKQLLSSKPSLNKLTALPKRNCIIGNPDDLVHLDWSLEWRE
jgi:hypothetical protein